MASDDKDTPYKNPGLQAIPDEETKGYIMQQTVCNHHLPLHFSNVVSVNYCSAILNSSWATISLFILVADVPNQGP